MNVLEDTPCTPFVDLKQRASSCQHLDIMDNTSLPCKIENRTISPGNDPSVMTRDICSRSVQDDSIAPHKTDVSSAVASIVSTTKDPQWCWHSTDTHSQSVGRPCQDSEYTDSRQIFFNDAFTKKVYVENDKYVNNGCDPEVNTLPETTEILCDYASVCDDDNLCLESMSPQAYDDDDQSKLLVSEVPRCLLPDHLTISNEHQKASYEVNCLACCNPSCNCVTNLSDTLGDERTCSQMKTTPVSTVAAMYITSLLNQNSAMSECVLSTNRDVFPPSPTVNVQSPQFSPLLATKVSELPTAAFPPIFYISIDETLPGNLSVAEKQNVVVKSELPNVNPRLAERCDSQMSSYSEKQDICRICHCEAELTNKLISPCLCSGSLKYIHLCCLQKWIKSSDKKSCELCNFDYIMTMKIRPFKQWEKLEMSVAERRKIVCSVTFHIIAITCVIWSLYVLIDRTTEEVNAGTLDWPFWTKLIVVAIGFTGGLVFMYVQCKMYLQLCFRWRQFNKLINIENAPEDVHLRAEAAARIKARTHEGGGVVNTVALQEVDSF